jgi:hypothetical protein
MCVLPCRAWSGRSRVKTYLRCRARRPSRVVRTSPESGSIYLVAVRDTSLPARRIREQSNLAQGVFTVRPVWPLRASLHPSARLFSISFFIRKVWTPQAARKPAGDFRRESACRALALRARAAPFAQGLPGRSRQAKAGLGRSDGDDPWRGIQQEQQDAFIRPDRVPTVWPRAEIVLYGASARLRPC